MVAGRPVELRELRCWVPALQDAAKYPLFAIMIGAELRKDSRIAGMNASQLVDRMVQSALRKAGGHQDEMDGLLQDLAVKAVSAGGGIASSDIHPKRTVRSHLIDSRLVSEEFGKVDFALPIFREWFAARALVEKKVSLVDIRPIADGWVFPIAIAISSENRALGQQLMAELAKSNIGLASLVALEVGENRFGGDEEPLADTDLEIGLAISRAMEDWGRGLGVLMPVIGPVTSDGSISTLGIELNQGMVYTSWYTGKEQLKPIVGLPKHADPFSGQYDPDWSRWRGSSKPSTRIWPWAMTKDMLVQSLSEQLDSRRLALQSTDAIRELAFEFACSVKARDYAESARVRVSEVLTYIDEDATEYASLRVGDSLYLAEDIQLIRQHLLKRHADGEEFIREPWPGPNKARPEHRSSWGWYETFTEQQLLERTKEVYAAALRIYCSIVETWFPAFGNNLRLKCMLPVRFEGRLFVPSSPSLGRDRPVLTWWPLPLGEREESQVAFELGSRDPFSEDGARSAITAARQDSLNRDGTFWKFTGILHVDGARPATELAHRWLISELREIGWTDLLS